MAFSHTIDPTTVSIGGHPAYAASMGGQIDSNEEQCLLYGGIFIIAHLQWD